MSLTSNERNDYIAIMRDMHKDAFGFRGSQNYFLLSDEELLQEYNSLIKSVDIAIDREKQEQKHATKAWKKLIRQYMQDFSIDLVTAIRWDVEAMGITANQIDFYNYGIYAYNHGLSYKWEKFLNKIMK